MGSSPTVGEGLELGYGEECLAIDWMLRDELMRGWVLRQTGRPFRGTRATRPREALWIPIPRARGRNQPREP